MARALRLDKMTLAALEVTLRTYADPVAAASEIPVLRMLSTPQAEIRARATALARAIAARVGDAAAVDVADDVSRAGGGALPMADIPSAVVRIAPRTLSAVDLERTLRLAEPPIVARIKDDRVLFDPRTLLPADEEIVVERLAAALTEPV